jgi:hypothetical protein
MLGFASKMAARAKKLKKTVRLTQVKLLAEFPPKFTGVQNHP